MIEELSETCRVLLQNKFEKLVNLVGFIIRMCIIACYSAVSSCLGQLKHPVFVKRLETMKGVHPEIAKCY